MHAGLVAARCWCCSSWAVEGVIPRCAVWRVTSGGPCVHREESRKVKREEHEQRVAERGFAGACKHMFEADRGGTDVSDAMMNVMRYMYG